MAINEKIINTLVSHIKELADNVTELKALQAEALKPVYTNETIRELLGVSNELIKKYRDNGEIGFTNVGDKYWYTADDVRAFLKKHHNKPFAYRAYQ